MNESRTGKKIANSSLYHNSVNQNLATFSIEPKEIIDDQTILQEEEEEESPLKQEILSQETFINPLKLDN